MAIEAESVEQELDALRIVLGALSGLSESGRSFVLRAAAERLGRELPTTDRAAREAVSSGESKLTAKAFLAEKRPTTDAQVVACLAYHLTREKDKPRFKTPEVVAVNAEAAGPRLPNPTKAVDNATFHSGFLAASGSGTKQITALGEAVVEALPDQEAVKRVMAEWKRRRVRRRRSRDRVEPGQQ